MSSNTAPCTNTNTNTDEPIKKKGRKTKGGKVKQLKNDNDDKPAPIANIILHLKCSANELNDYNNKINKMLTNPTEYNPDIPPNILTYNENDKQFCPYENNDAKTNNYAYDCGDNVVVSVKCDEHASLIPQVASREKEKREEDEPNMKDINAKLKKLKFNLCKNVNLDKSSACFWCTCDFDNPPCYIPLNETASDIYGYGSFCRPECAMAFLMKENIDDTTKFERCFLLNKIYGKIYDYKKNIKPAPSPHYLLDKYFGNLTIQEYRKLLKTEHLLLVLEKPMTRILPELHEDNEEIKLNVKGTVSGSSNGTYKVKRQSDKHTGPSKTSIINEKFGLQ